MSAELLKLAGTGVVALVEIRGSMEDEMTFAAKEGRPERKVKKRSINAELAETGQHLGLVQWSDRDTGLLPEFAFKRGQKAIACLRSLGTDNGQLSGIVDRLLPV
jgi:hypothetical protein